MNAPPVTYPTENRLDCLPEQVCAALSHPVAIDGLTALQAAGAVQCGEADARDLLDSLVETGQVVVTDDGRYRLVEEVAI